MNFIQQQLTKLKIEQLGLRIAIAQPDQSSIEMVAELATSGLLKPLFVGKRSLIEALLKKNGFPEGNEIIDSEQPEITVCELYLNQQVDLIMKGDVHTDDLLRSVIKSGLGIKGRRI